MDGRIVKEDIATRGAHFVVPWNFCAAETSDERPRTNWLYIRGESSHGSRAVCVEDRSREMKGADLLGPVRRRSSGGFVGSLGNPSTDVPVGEVWVPDVPSPCGTGSALVGRGRGFRGSYVHPTPRSQVTHAVHGCLASHFWWGGLSPRIHWTRLRMYRHSLLFFA